MIIESDVARVIEATDILELVQQYIPLRRSGKEWFGVCAIHKERSGSFSVNPSKQKFLCRGCNVGGDAVAFVRLMEGISFPAAVRLLADRAGITLGQPAPAIDPYVKQVAAESVAYWSEARYRYAQRMARYVTLRNATAALWRDTGSADIWVYFHHYARSVNRWERIIARLDKATRGELLARYVAIRARYPRVALEYRSALELASACASVESRATGKITAGNFEGLLGAIGARLDQGSPC